MNSRPARPAALFAVAALSSSTAFAQFNCLAFERPTLLPLSHLAASVDVGDLNADGRVDIITAGGDAFTLYIAHGATGAAGMRPIRTPMPATAAAFGDFDGNGHMDAAIIQDDPAQLRVLIGDGSTNFYTFDDYPLEATYGEAVSLTVADFNNDGADDLFIGIRSGSGEEPRLQFFISDGSRGFESRSVDVLLPGAFHGQVVDLDLDGDLDVLSSTFAGPSAVIMLLNDGDANFTSQCLYPRPQEHMGLVDAPATTGAAAADFDLDGDIDIAAMHVIGTITFFIQRNGVYWESPALDPGDVGWFIDTADFNLDGRPDLVLGKPLGSARLQLLENITTGEDMTFASPFAIQSEGFPLHITTTEFDDEPGPDIVFADAGESLGGVGVASAALPEDSHCVYDLSGSGVVDHADLAVILAFWGAPGSPADLTQDLNVNARDIAELLSTWGAHANPRAMHPQYDWSYGQRAVHSEARQAIRDSALADGADFNTDGRVSAVELADWIAARN